MKKSTKNYLKWSIITCFSVSPLLAIVQVKYGIVRGVMDFVNLFK